MVFPFFSTAATCCQPKQASCSSRVLTAWLPIAVSVVGVIVADPSWAQQNTLQSSEPASPALEQVLDVVEDSTASSTGADERRLSGLDLELIPSPSVREQTLAVDLNELVLIPSTTTVNWLDNQFDASIAPINTRIEFRQALLQELLSDPDSNDNRIRQVQSILSQLRAERDRIAIEHLLLVRQVSENGELPEQSVNSSQASNTQLE